MVFYGIKLSLKKIVFCSLILFNCYAVSNTLSNSSSKPPIKIGMSTALTGPSGELGGQMKLGVQIYFDKINAAGGIGGRKLQLIALDDQYEPSKTAPNMRQLIDGDDVLAVLGNMGTATTLVASQIANEKHTLLFGPFTGDRVLRKNPPHRYIFHFRASYEQETQNIIEGLYSAGFKPEDLAFFIQNDSYGDSVYQGAKQDLMAKGYLHPELLPLGHFDRNTANIKDGLETISSQAKHPIKAFIIVGTYKPNADFIKAAKKEYPDALYINISFVGSEELARQLDKNEKGIIVTEVVPPSNSSLPAVQEYRKDLQTYAKGAVPNSGSLEGYLLAKLFILGLQKAAVENKLDREGLIDTFESMRYIDIGLGMKISFDVTDHQGMQTVWPVILKNGIFVPFNWQDLKKQ